MLTRVVLITLDGLGVGALPDAGETAAGSNTLAHVAEAVGGLVLPTLEALGLGHIGSFRGITASTNPDGCFGKMAQASPGTDAIAGHWELAGLVISHLFPTFPEGFPSEVIYAVQLSIGRAVLGNRAASGAEIIEELGAEHVKTGFPIVYTGAGSVLQLAAHQDVIPVAELYRMCRAVRKVLVPPHAVSRVTARPFTGTAGSYVCAEGRRDFVLEPPAPTVFDEAKRAGQPVVGIGTIDDLFTGRGLTRAVHADAQDAVFDQLQRTLATVPRGVIAANVVEADHRYGHRKDAAGFAAAVQDFDRHLPGVLSALRPGDALFLTGNHGADPSIAGVAHTREYVPLLAYGPRLGRGVSLGTRHTCADVGQTIADAMGAKMLSHGESFLDVLQPG